MTNPSHKAYIVIEPKQAGRKAGWREVGALWPHKNGNGFFDLVIPPGISLSGRIVIIERKEEEPLSGAEFLRVHEEKA